MTLKFTLVGILSALTTIPLSHIMEALIFSYDIWRNGV